MTDLKIMIGRCSVNSYQEGPITILQILAALNSGTQMKIKSTNEDRTNKFILKKTKENTN